MLRHPGEEHEKANLARTLRELPLAERGATP
jgi:hypothetical protein